MRHFGSLCTVVHATFAEFHCKWLRSCDYTCLLSCKFVYLIEFFHNKFVKDCFYHLWTYTNLAVETVYMYEMFASSEKLTTNMYKCMKTFKGYKSKWEKTLQIIFLALLFVPSGIGHPEATYLKRMSHHYQQQ